MPNNIEHSETQTTNDEDFPQWLQEIRGTAPPAKPPPPKEGGQAPWVASPQRKGPKSHKLNYYRPQVKASLRLWYQAFRYPNLRTFQAEHYRANFSTAFIWMGVTGLMGGLMGGLILILMLGPLLYFISEPGLAPFDFQTLVWGGLIMTGLNVVLSTIFAPIYLLIASAILFIIAKWFGGEGDFEAQTYLVAILFAPFYLALRALSLTPIIGWLLLLGYFVYLIVPGRYVIQATHQLSEKKSLYVVLIPVGLIATFYGLFLFTWSISALQALWSWWVYW